MRDKAFHAFYETLNKEEVSELWEWTRTRKNFHRQIKTAHSMFRLLSEIFRMVDTGKSVGLSQLDEKCFCSCGAQADSFRNLKHREDCIAVHRIVDLLVQWYEILPFDWGKYDAERDAERQRLWDRDVENENGKPLETN